MKTKVLLFALALFCCNLLNAQCFEDRHTTLEKDHWISCSVTENPNPDRDPSLWIMYDFGLNYSLEKSTIWNCNVYEKTQLGIQSAIIDYSADGVNWIEWGEFNLERANASSFYEGIEGPDFDGLEAQFLLITVLSTFEEQECACLSEVRFETTGVISSTENIELNKQLILAPNPAVDFIDVQFESTAGYNESRLEVFDLNGKLIHKEQIQVAIGSNSYKIGLSNYAPGTYIASLNLGDKVLSKQFIVIPEKK